VSSIVFLDQFTKYLALNTISYGQNIEIIGEFFRFSLARNPGGLFGTRIGNNLVYIIFATAGIGLIIYYYHILSRKHGHIAAASVGFLLGGALGNLIDRFFHAMVTDFIDVGIGGHRWPTFNIADSSILVGLGLIFLLEFKTEKQDKHLEKCNDPEKQENATNPVQ
jgi:signal peptidase II